MQGIDIRLKEVAVRDAILAALARTGLQPTEGTKVNFLSGPGEPVVVEVTELKMGQPAPAPPPVQPPQAAPTSQKRPAQSKPASKSSQKRAAVKDVSDVEEALFGGQEAWPEAQPYLPDDDGKIAMPDAGKHVEGQLDDEEVVMFDAKRFAVDPVPEGEAPSLRSSTTRAYDVPEEQDDVPEAYRALPSPVEDE
jgi:hypothetical protein